MEDNKIIISNYSKYEHFHSLSTSKSVAAEHIMITTFYNSKEKALEPIFYDEDDHDIRHSLSYPYSLFFVRNR